MITRQCSKCKEEKPAEKFQNYFGTPMGQCNDCKAAAMRVLRRTRGIKERTKSTFDPETLTKLCTACNEAKPVSEFSRNERATGGYASQCKKCKAAKAKEKRNHVI